ncbi:unnamed protein product, partial [Candidula unifasciata]
KVVYFMHAIVVVASIISVVLFTIVLIVKLRVNSKWRKSMNSQQKQQASMTNKERTTIVMIVLIACMLLVCYTPTIILSLITFFEPDFSPGGKYVNLHYILWSFALLFETVNSSVNIFLYLKMSSNYRLYFYSLCFKRD